MILAETVRSSLVSTGIKGRVSELDIQEKNYLNLERPGAVLVRVDCDSVGDASAIVLLEEETYRVFGRSAETPYRLIERSGSPSRSLEALMVNLVEFLKCVIAVHEHPPLLAEIRRLLRVKNRREHAYPIGCLGDLCWGGPHLTEEFEYAEFVRIDGDRDYAVITFVDGEFRFFVGPYDGERPPESRLGSASTLDEAIELILPSLRD